MLISNIRYITRYARYRHHFIPYCNCTILNKPLYKRPEPKYHSRNDKTDHMICSFFHSEVSNLQCSVCSMIKTTPIHKPLQFICKQLYRHPNLLRVQHISIQNQINNNSYIIYYCNGTY